ncbi:GNAT family N-acetyltransferase (plasmid) [Phormidium sp. CLA17]|uniref:GNAT family N-acetyltransferase n=1 Tax=Leptolyngbya sp. Cla-17 TaxID=2803751 RepID=UPI001491CFFD|nr:GNAT family N-acetyltransferase [Leptolyngbya sp. Cla-17]MBM0744853.1 GNAT family N-acetyltransferase [Leptolyngbya sp. Cla-17]
MTPEIKIASIEELEILLPLVRAFHEFEDLHITEEQRKSSLTALLANALLGGVWLVYYNHQPVGYIALCLGYSIEFAGKDAFIDEFYIRPEFQGKGLGKQTLEFIKMAAKDLDIRAIHLEVARTNTNAHKLYSRSNFEVRDKYVLMSVNL